jgi:hypothetical protein
MKKKGGELSKIREFNEALIKEVQKLKQVKSSKRKWEKDKSKEELKTKDEQIGRLINHNKKIIR